jgi:acyl carrier protein
MESNEILAKVQEVFRDVFDNEEIVLTSETTADDVEDWNSLNHMQLVVAIEKEFKISFTLNEILGWVNVGAMVECIGKKVA